MCPPIKALPALTGTLLLAGCATVLTPRSPSLALHTRPDSVTIHANGRVLGMAPIADLRLQPTGSLALDLRRDGWQPAHVPVRRTLRNSFGFNAIVPGVLALGALEAGADPADVLLLALAVPAGALVDLLTGAAWEHDPRVLEVTLLPAPPPAVARLPDLPADSARATVAATLLLRRMAQAADEAGCDSVVSETWLDESDLVAGSGAVSRGDSALIARKVQVQVDSVTAELRALCSRSNPLLDSLRATEASLAGAAIPPAAETGGTGAMTPAELCAASAFGHCITFPLGSARLGGEFEPALRGVAEEIRATRLPVFILIQGTADPAGESARSRWLGLARAMAVRDALVRLGVPREWLIVESCGDEARCQLVPGAAGTTRGAELNRRVIFHLRVREVPP